MCASHNPLLTITRLITAERTGCDKAALLMVYLVAVPPLKILRMFTSHNLALLLVIAVLGLL
jgi:hypothetical protein